MTASPQQEIPPADGGDPDEVVQMNVRVPRSLRDAIDARRAQVRNGLSQSQYVANAVRFALQHAPAAGHFDTPAGRTAPPPARRP